VRQATECEGSAASIGGHAGVIKSQSEENYARAAECLEATQRAAAPEIRDVYLYLMRRYIELAEAEATLGQERS
jgi:hypothetical protein